MYTVLVSLSYILPKCAKSKEPEDEHCVSWCMYISYHIHDPIPLDNPKNHTALPYITFKYLMYTLYTPILEYLASEKSLENVSLTKMLPRMSLN